MNLPFQRKSYLLVIASFILLVGVVAISMKEGHSSSQDDHSTRTVEIQLPKHVISDKHSLAEDKSSEFSTVEKAGSHGPMPLAIRQQVERLKARGEIAAQKWGEAIELGWNDFGSAFNYLKGYLSGTELQEKEKMLVILVGFEDISRLGEGLSLIADVKQETFVRDNVISSWAKRNPMKVIQYAKKNLVGEESNSAIYTAFMQITKTGDFSTAEYLLKEMPYSSARTGALRNLAAAMSTQDVSQAMTWIKSLDLPEDRRDAEMSIISARGSTLELDMMVKLANSTVDNSVKNEWVKAIAGRLMNTDLESAIDWSKTLPTDIQESVQSGIAVKMAQSDLSRGTAYALTISGAQQSQVISTIENNIIAKDPRIAAAWLTGLPNALQEQAAGTLALRWYDIDSIALSDWINTLPNGRPRDRALLAMSTRLSASDSAAAQEVARKIVDTRLRETALRDSGAVK